MLEKDIQREIVGYLKKIGIVFSVTNADRSFRKNGMPRTSKVKKGWPDITALLPVVINNKPVAISFGIEVKTKTGRLREHQVLTKNEMERDGGIYLVARSREDVRDYLLCIIHSGEWKLKSELEEKVKKVKFIKATYEQ